MSAIPAEADLHLLRSHISRSIASISFVRILAVNDECFRENLGLIADTSISDARVAWELDALVRLYGNPPAVTYWQHNEATQPDQPQQRVA